MIINRKSISMFVVSFLIVSFVFLALPEEGNAGFDPLPSGSECCQLDGGCFDIMLPPPGVPGMTCSDENVVFGAVCDESADQCVVISKDVPTLSEWGLIAMAGALGLIGFIMVIRKRRATA